MSLVFIRRPNANDLPKLPKLDKSTFIKTFISEQKTHANAHAAQGRVVLSPSKAANTTSKERRNDLPARNDAPGFATPVLKPRVRKPVPQPSDPPAKSPFSKKQNPKSSVPPQLKSKKRRVVSSSDEEAEARRSERRDRKRAKRAIVRPTVPDEDVNEDESESVPNKRRKGKSKKEKKSRTPAALALMHGFAANNIGKNRLTKAPSLGMGVFCKGKASTKASVHPRRPTTTKKNAADFSETQFLGRTKKRSTARQQSTKRSVASVDEESVQSEESSQSGKLVSSDTSRSESQLSANTAMLQKKTARPEEAEKAGPSAAHAQPIRSTESEVWDIELEFLDKDGSNTTVKTLSNGKAADDMKTIVLPTNKPVWTKPSIPNTSTQHSGLGGAPSISGSESFSSLHPSQSASQCPRIQSHPKSADVENIRSHFFPEPDSEPLTPRKNKPSTPPPSTRDEEHSDECLNLNPSPLPIHEVPDSNLTSIFARSDAEDLTAMDIDETFEVNSPVSVQDVATMPGDWETDLLLNDLLPPQFQETYIEDGCSATAQESLLYECSMYYDDSQVSDDGLSHHTNAWLYEECVDPNAVDYGLEVVEADCEGEFDGSFEQQFSLDDEDFTGEWIDEESSDGPEDVRTDLSCAIDDSVVSSVAFMTQQFSQGKALLLGVESAGTRLLPRSPSPFEMTAVSRAEADVARNMHKHWLPQRP